MSGNINLPSFYAQVRSPRLRRTSTKLDVWLDEENPLSAPGLDTGNPTDIADVQYLPKIRRRKDRSCLFSPLSPSRLAKELTTASETRSLAMRDTSSASKVRREATRRVSSADRDAIVAAAAGHIAWNNKFYRRLDEIVARDPESESVISPRRVNVNGVETRPVIIRPLYPRPFLIRRRYTSLVT